jgi:hypothetical protein
MEKSARFYTLTSIILLAALSRLIPHPWNVTPLTAIALFGGVEFSNKKAAFLVPLSALLISDLMLGFHSTLPFVYGCFTLTVYLGLKLQNKKLMPSLMGITLLSSVLFFLVTNFGHWLVTSMYPKTMEGLLSCLIAGLPFFRNALFGDLFFTSAIFGLFHLAKSKFSVLQPSSIHAQ